MTAASLRALGWQLHLAADHFPKDAQEIDDVTWISYGLDNRWGLLSKDRKIRYHGHERDATAPGALFVLSNGNLTTHEMARWFHTSKQATDRAVLGGVTGIWTVYQDHLVHSWP